MDNPRLSINSRETYESNLTPPATVGDQPSYAKVDVGPVVVNNGGTGVRNGNIATFTLNQYLSPDRDDWDPGIVKRLVADAVQINTDTKKFFPDHKCDELVDKAEELVDVQKKWFCIIAALVFLSIFTLLSSSLFLLQNSSQDTQFFIAGNQTSSDIENIEGGPRIMPRNTWLAQPPIGPIPDNILPVQRVIVCHTATDSCQTTPECILQVRLIQQFHVESRNWFDIGYNFLIGGDGYVYIGRGFNKEGAHTKGYNNGTLGIAFIGSYIYEMPNNLQLEAFHKLVDVGVKLKKIAKNYTLAAQCQLQVTAAPGLVLAHNMTTWPHFNSSLPIQCTSVDIDL